MSACRDLSNGYSSFKDFKAYNTFILFEFVHSLIESFLFDKTNKLIEPLLLKFLLSLLLFSDPHLLLNISSLDVTLPQTHSHDGNYANHDEHT
jgi:hypothetical protein